MLLGVVPTAPLLVTMPGLVGGVSVDVLGSWVIIGSFLGMVWTLASPALFVLSVLLLFRDLRALVVSG